METQHTVLCARNGTHRKVSLHQKGENRHGTA